MAKKFMITIPDAAHLRIAQAKLSNYRYEPLVFNPSSGEMEANPESAQDFLFRKRIEEEKEHVKAFEVPDLAKADRAARIAEIDSWEITVEEIIE